jgi:hypothetical protein
MTTFADLSSVLGTTWFIALTFVAGAVIGTPLWRWVSKFLPWNKDI